MSFLRKSICTIRRQSYNMALAHRKKMADFSEAALNNVRTKDLGEVGNMLSSLVIDLKSFDVTEQDKGFKGLFKKSSNKITSMKAKYDKAEVNVNNVCTALENHQVTLR